MAALARRAPDIRVDVIRADDPEATLREGRADVAFLRMPVRDRSLPHAVVATEARVVFAPAHHLLARAGRAGLADLAGIGDRRAA